jgi:hypothetical protein
VHLCFAEGGPRSKGCANRIARDLTEELRHEDSFLVGRRLARALPA